MPLYMIDKYASNLRKLKAIKLDWGRNDVPRFPLQCLMFSEELENHGIISLCRRVYRNTYQ